MNPYFKRFIKKKVQTKMFHKLAKEDLVDFFKFYSIKYESNSTIVLNALKCKKTLSKNNLVCVLSLDVKN